VVGRATVRDVHGREGAARVLALIGSAMSVVPMLGPIAGGFVEAWAGWRWNFVLLTVSGAALVALVALYLPETNAWRDPRALDARRIAANLAGFLSTPGFMRYALAIAFSYAGLFSFISGSSFVFVDVLGVDPRGFGFWFAFAVFGYFTGTRIAGHFTLRLGIAGMMPLACAVMLAGGLAMAALALSGLAVRDSLGAPAVGVPMYVYMVGFGISWPNAQAGAIGPYPEKAGAASATLGFLQTAIAALVGVGVGHLHDGTARPMALAIALAAIVTAAAYRLLAKR
jgi:DHA1 family bicyclomycin/chloramphenicol resistance-like MFS transporter